jgi:hypothetical protein
LLAKAYEKRVLFPVTFGYVLTRPVGHTLGTAEESGTNPPRTRINLGLSANKGRKLVQTHDCSLDVTREETYYTHPTEAGPDDFIDWNEVPEEMDDPMTIGIGVLCEGMKCIVLASDTRASYAVGRPNDLCAKQFDIPPLPFVGNIAGEVSCASAVISQMCAEFKKLPSFPETKTEHVIRAFNEARFHIFCERVNTAMQRYLCMSLAEWKKGKRGKVGARIYRGGKAIIRSTALPIHLIVGGFLGRGEPILLRGIKMFDHEEEASPGVYTIGNREAMIRANEVLRKRKQCQDYGLPRTLLHIYEALEAARRDKTVGPPSWYVVLKLNQTMRFPSDSLHLKEWARHYHQRDSTVSLEQNEIAYKQVESQLIMHKPRLMEFEK